MVDFNNDTTVTTPSGDVIKILRLERRYNLLEALENYYLQKELGQAYQHELAIVKSRLKTLKVEIEGEISRKWKGQALREFETLLDSSKEVDILAAWDKINLLLDDIGLTRMDTRHRYDSTRVETENRAKKL